MDSSRLWTFEDIRDATVRYQACKDSDDPTRHYFYGVTLEVSGQADCAKEKFVAFRQEARRKFGDLQSGADGYEAQSNACLENGDEKSSEHFANMARILRSPYPIPQDKGKCEIM